MIVREYFTSHLKSADHAPKRFLVRSFHQFVRFLVDFLSHLLEGHARDPPRHILQHGQDINEVVARATGNCSSSECFLYSLDKGLMRPSSLNTIGYGRRYATNVAGREPANVSIR